MTKYIKYIILVLFILLPHYFKAQSDFNTQTKELPGLTQYFGTIGDIPVEVYLQKRINTIEGYISYIGYFSENDSNVTKIISGAVNEDKTFRIYGYGIFEGKWDSEVITGTWIDLNKDSLKYPFILISAANIYKDWLTYSNTRLGIKFKYPPDAVIKEASGEEYCPDGRKYLGDCKYLEIFQNNKIIKKDFIEICMPEDTSTNLLERVLFLSTWTEDTCCRSVITNSHGGNRLDTAFSTEIGDNTYYVQSIGDAGMSKYYETSSYATCRINDNRCFAFNYSTAFVSFGPFNVPYHNGYYNYNYVEKGEYNGPKPLNKKAEDAMILYILKSFNLVY